MIPEVLCAVAAVVSVYDGDTFRAEVELWPGLTMESSIRVRGIDTPEIGWRADCDAERRQGEAAASGARAMLEQAATVMVCDPKRDKYAGRVVADVYIDGDLLAGRMIGAGLARPYDGGKRLPWCPP